VLKAFPGATIVNRVLNFFSGHTIQYFWEYPLVCLICFQSMLVSIARYAFKLSYFWLSRDTVWNTSWTWCLLAFYFVRPSPAVWLELFASTVRCFLSRLWSSAFKGETTINTEWDCAARRPQLILLKNEETEDELTTEFPYIYGTT